MVLDTIKTYKNGAWHRAIYYKWNGTAWEVTKVYTPEYSRFVDANSRNHNAIPVVKTYTPTWWAQINNSQGFVDKVSGTNASGSFKVGTKYGETDSYSTLVGMPYSQVISDSYDKFGIAKVSCTSTILSVGGYGFGRCEYYLSNKINRPNLYDTESSFELGGWQDYWFLNMEYEDSSMAAAIDINIFENIKNGSAKAIYLYGEMDTRVSFEIQNLSWQVTWAGK